MNTITTPPPQVETCKMLLFASNLTLFFHFLSISTHHHHHLLQSPSLSPRHTN